ncbi:hypothetical protein C5167_043799 [Papaver somniferum]|uniref:SWIM-type domain-containing protein n=1 Tax=Papaver somniferum TaxID=3469 RepID=A0A4Y7LAB7_PAPSO|nr:hypothetical protein C5167_043799 [Papaver somniferum]
MMACSRWISLRNSDFYFTCVYEGNKVPLRLDFQLQSMILFYIDNNISSFDLSIEFVGESCSSLATSTDYDGDVVDDLAEDNNTAFIEDGALVSRPRRLKEWENDIGDVGQQFCALFVTTTCKWKFHAPSIQGNLDLFEIKTFYKEHTCGASIADFRQFKCKRKFVQSVIMDDIRHNPHKKKASDIQKIFELDYGIDLSYHQAYSGLEYGKKVLWGDDVKSYLDFQWYGDVVNKYNPGSKVVLEVDKVSKKFERFFISFEDSLRGFNFCHLMIILDATFLVGKHKGALMVAVGKDANQGIFPIAFGIVDIEDKPNWVWSLENLKEILDEKRFMTFISDRGKGLIHAVPEVFPGCFHSFYFYHMKLNIPVSKNDKRYKETISMFKYVYYALTPQGFASALKSMKLYNLHKMIIWLKGIPHENWATYAFLGIYGEKSSSVIESFNSFIKNDKGLPHSFLAGQIRVHLMDWMYKRKKESEKWKSVLTPRMEHRLKTIKDVGRSYRVKPAGDSLFEVYTLAPPKKHLVELYSRSCTCRRWDANRFPCSHVVQCILRYSKHIVYHYIDLAFTTDCYRNAYSHPIVPIPDVEKPNEVDEANKVNAPTVVRGPGRQKKKEVHTSF